MTKPASAALRFTFRLAFCLLVALASRTRSARADVPPACDSLSSMITCAAADVGKDCKGAGKCVQLGCAGMAGPQMTVYKCVVCPTIVAAAPGTCTISNMTTACGDGDGGTGTCGVRHPGCDGAEKFVCQTSVTGTPTGPPSGGGGGGGCDVAPIPSGPTAIGLGLLGIGIVIFVIERLRRRSR